MIIYVDENISEHVAEGFNTLQIPEGYKSGFLLTVKYIPTAFGRGAKDADWIPKLKQGDCVITQDVNIQRRKHELALYRKHGIGMFYMRGASKRRG